MELRVSSTKPRGILIAANAPKLNLKRAQNVVKARLNAQENKMEKLDKELGQWLWFLAGAAAVVTAGIAKIALGERFDNLRK